MRDSLCTALQTKILWINWSLNAIDTITLSIPHVPAGFIFESNAQLRYSVLNDCFIAGVEVNVIYDVGEWRRNRLEHPALTSLYLFVCVIFCRNSSSFFEIFFLSQVSHFLSLRLRERNCFRFYESAIVFIKNWQT